MTATSEGEDAIAAASASPKVQAIRDGIDTVRTQASDIAHDAVSVAKDGLDQARDTVSDAYALSRDYAREAYASAREKAKSTGQQASDGIATNPLVALAAGIAVGAVIGALLPRTEREKKALGVVGEKLNAIAKEAVGAAKDAGQDKLDELGFSREKARETVKSLLDGALAAAASAGSAAMESAKQKRDEV